MLSLVAANNAVQSRFGQPSRRTNHGCRPTPGNRMGPDRIMEPGLLSRDTNAHLRNMAIVPATAAARGLRSVVLDFHGGPDGGTVRGDGPGPARHDCIRGRDRSDHR